MPLQHYGVAVGSLVRFYRDPPDDFGRWYHGHVEVQTPSGIWTSALDVDTPIGVGISYRTSPRLNRRVLGAVLGLSPGFHELASNSTSGAIDYIRSPFLQDRLIWPRPVRPRGLPKVQPLPQPRPAGAPPLLPPQPSLPRSLYERLLRLLQHVGGWLPPGIHVRFRPWLRSDGDNALRALEQELLVGRTVYLFGERFTSGQGVHDVHQNQGDPAGSQWWAQNGIWQDGAVAVERPDGSLFIWQVRFNSQATRTDNDGHPI